MTSRPFVSILALLPISLGGCSSRKEAGGAPNTVVGPAFKDVQTARRNPKIPVGVSFRVIKETEEYNSLSKKRILEIQLNTRVSADVLREIALELKSKEERQYERTFIFYSLAESVPGITSDPWATSHFSPTFEVRVLGLSDKEADFLVGQPVTHGDKRVGTWIVERQSASHRATIYRGGAAIKMEVLVPGGERSTTEMVEVPSRFSRIRFKPNGSGDQYEVDSGGTLRIYDAYNPEKVIAAGLPLN